MISQTDNYKYIHCKEGSNIFFNEYIDPDLTTEPILSFNRQPRPGVKLFKLDEFIPMSDMTRGPLQFDTPILNMTDTSNAYGLYPTVKQEDPECSNSMITIVNNDLAYLNNPLFPSIDLFINSDVSPVISTLNLNYGGSNSI